MRQVHPEAMAEVDVERCYLDDERPPPPGRPWVALDMVASADGATAVAGRSGALGGPGDRMVFNTLRAVADVVLAGAGTVRTEHYGPPRLAEHLQAARRDAGRPSLPRLAVLSGRLALDLTTPFFTESATRPIVITTTSPGESRLDAARDVADVVVAGDEGVDLARAFSALADMGAATVVCEGGPVLNGHLLRAGLVDELCMTIAPRLVSGGSHRVVVGDELADPARLRLARVLVDGDELFLRYLVDH